MKENNFKQTEIGLIPKDWEVVRLEEILFPDRKKLKHKQYDGSIPIVEKIQFDTGEIVFRKKRQTRTDLYIGEKGRLLTSKINFHQGAVAIITNEGKIAATTHYEIYRVNERKGDLKFLWYYFRSPFFREIFYHEMKFAGFKKEANYKFIKNFKLPLPPIPEQRKIARVLDKIQQAIELQDRIIEQAKRLKKSLMQKLFIEGLYGEEQKETEIGLIPKSWEVVRLGEVFEVQQGKQLSRKRKLKKDEIECKFLRTSNVFWEGIKLQNLDTMFVSKKEIDRLKVRKGDIFVCEGGDVGRTAILEEDIDFDLIFQNHLHRLRPKSEDIYPNFFVYWMEKHIKLDRVHIPANVTTIPNLSASRLKSFLLPLPPLEEQKQIAHILSTVDRKIEVEQKRKQVLKELFKTMLHKLMSREIRLKEVEV